MPYYKPGDWNSVCARCGFEYKASELRKTWDGFFCCEKCWEPRHPQDFVRARPDRMDVPWTQKPPDQFIAICDLPGQSCICDYALCDCSICDFIPGDIQDWSI